MKLLVIIWLLLTDYVHTSHLKKENLTKIIENAKKKTCPHHDCDTPRYDNYCGCDRLCLVYGDCCQQYSLIQQLYADDITDSDITDRDTTDGHITDSHITDSDITDGHITDRDITDSDITDIDVTYSGITDSDIADRDITDNNITHGDITDSAIMDSNIPDSDITDSDITDSDITDGHITDRDITDGDITDADTETSVYNRKEHQENWDNQKTDKLATGTEQTTHAAVVSKTENRISSTTTTNTGQPANVVLSKMTSKLSEIVPPIDPHGERKVDKKVIKTVQELQDQDASKIKEHDQSEMDNKQAKIVQGIKDDDQSKKDSKQTKTEQGIQERGPSKTDSKPTKTVQRIQEHDESKTDSTQSKTIQDTKDKSDTWEPVNPAIRCIDVFLNLRYWLVARCPPDWKDDFVRQMCEVSYPGVMPEYLLPVKVISTGLSYKNMMCGLCHGYHISDLEYWTYAISCKGDYPLTFQQFIVAMNDRHCFLSFTDTFRRPCRHVEIDTCDTGLLDSGKMDLEMWKRLQIRCTRVVEYVVKYVKYNDIRNTKYDGQYKNRDCLVCNGGRPEMASCSIPANRAAIEQFVLPMSSLAVNLIYVQETRDTEKELEKEVDCPLPDQYVFVQHALKCKVLACTSHYSFVDLYKTKCVRSNIWYQMEVCRNATIDQISSNNIQKRSDHSDICQDGKGTKIPLHKNEGNPVKFYYEVKNALNDIQNTGFEKLAIRNRRLMVGTSEIVENCTEEVRMGVETEAFASVLAFIERLTNEYAPFPWLVNITMTRVLFEQDTARADMERENGNFASQNGNSMADMAPQNGKSMTDMVAQINGNSMADMVAQNGNSIADMVAQNGNLEDMKQQNGSSMADNMQSQNGNSMADMVIQNDNLADILLQNGNSMADNMESQNSNSIANMVPQNGNFANMAAQNGNSMADMASQNGKLANMALQNGNSATDTKSQNGSNQESTHDSNGDIYSEKDDIVSPVTSRYHKRSNNDKRTHTPQRNMLRVEIKICTLYETSCPVVNIDNTLHPVYDKQLKTQIWRYAVFSKGMCRDDYVIYEREERNKRNVGLQRVLEAEKRYAERQMRSVGCVWKSEVSVVIVWVVVVGYVVRGW